MYDKYLALDSIIKDLEKQAGFSFDECRKNLVITFGDCNKEIIKGIKPSDLVEARDNLMLQILDEFTGSYKHGDPSKIQVKWDLSNVQVKYVD